MLTIDHHHTHQTSWLRAAVLGANDGIISTASLIMGIAVSGADHNTVVITGVAGLVAGALSMAAGEYVSVSSQADSEKANLEIERKALADNHDYEREELTQIYIQRGLSPTLAAEVTEQLMAKDALAAHARDEMGLTEENAAQPLQAAIASAFSFAIGAGLPLLVAWQSTLSQLAIYVGATSLIALALLGSLAAKKGSANVLKGAFRVTFWGALAMATTSLLGQWLGIAF